MTIKQKLIFVIMAMSALPTAMIGYLTTEFAENALRTSIAANFRDLARQKAMTVDLIIKDRQFEASWWANSPVVIEAARRANRNNAARLQTKAEIDHAWKQDRQNNDHARMILENETSALLRDLQQRDLNRYGELFLTDRTGAAIAMTRTLSDYDQADEDWWIGAFNGGPDNTFIDDRGFDESAGAPVLGIAVPIMERGQAAGVLKINYKIADVMTLVSNDPSAGTHFCLVRSQGEAIVHTEGIKHDFKSREMQRLLQETKPGSVATSQGNAKILLGYAPVQASIHRRFKSAADPSVGNERWTPTVWQFWVEEDQDLAFQPISRMRQWAILVTCAMVVVGTIASFIIAGALAAPLRELEFGTRMIGAGNLNHRVHLSDSGEMGQLAEAFNTMIDKRQAAEERAKTYHRQLEEANRELEAFSYSVSHDLKAPLRAIDGFGGILVSDHKASLDQEGQRLLHMIRDNTSRMSQQIDDILRLSRLSLERIVMTEVDMNELVIEVKKQLEDSMASTNINFLIDALPPVHADHTLMRCVMENLLSNAIKFTKHSQVPTIEVGVKATDRETIYFIKDNGAGFDMAYAESLFRLFRRLHRCEEYPGTGVGLAIVNRILHRHGGRIWAEGTVNEGATFFFTLPKQGTEHDCQEPKSTE